MYTLLTTKAPLLPCIYRSIIFDATFLSKISTEKASVSNPENVQLQQKSFSFDFDVQTHNATCQRFSQDPGLFPFNQDFSVTEPLLPFYSTENIDPFEPFLSRIFEICANDLKLHTIASAEDSSKMSFVSPNDFLSYYCIHPVTYVKRLLKQNQFLRSCNIYFQSIKAVDTCSGITCCRKDESHLPLFPILFRLETKNLSMELLSSANNRCILEKQNPIPDTKMSFLEIYAPLQNFLGLGLWCHGAKEIVLKTNELSIRTIQRLKSKSIWINKHNNIFNVRRKLHTPDEISNRIGEVYSALQKRLRQIPIQKFVHSGMSPRKWKKFTLSLENEVRSENLQAIKEGRDRLDHLLKKYDEFKIMESDQCSELMLSTYEMKMKSGFKARHGQACVSMGEEGENGVEETNELHSFSDLFHQFDGTDSFLGSHPLQTMGDISRDENIVRECLVDQNVNLGGAQDNNTKSKDNIETQNNPIRQNSTSIDSLNHIAFSAPHGLMCTSWTLKLAETCISFFAKGVVFLPPSLSPFPILAAIINSFISASLRDHRVAIICEDGTRMISSLKEYLLHTLRGIATVEAIRKNELTSPSSPCHGNVLGNVLILDSFDFSLTTRTSLLIVIGPGVVPLTALPEVPCLSSSDLDNNVITSIRDWRSIPYIFVFPYQSCNLVCHYLSKATKIAQVLNIDQAIVVNDRFDVNLSLLLSRPEFVFLVPPRDVMEFISILEMHSCAQLGTYKKFKKLQMIRNISKEERLIHVDVEALRDILQSRGLTCEKDIQSLETLYALRQARTFALCDGFSSAIAYLKHYIRSASTEVVNTLQAVIAETERNLWLHQAKREKNHPMAISIAKSLITMKHKFDTEPPSLRSLHRKEAFRPLIITNSKETYDGLLQGVHRAVNFFEATANDVAICENRYLRKEASMPGYPELQQDLSLISHFFHIIDDRANGTSHERLSPNVLEFILGGRARLISVMVDESRCLERIWRQNEIDYSNLCRLARNERGTISTKQLPPFLTTSPLSALYYCDGLNQIGNITSNQLSKSVSKRAKLKATPMRGPTHESSDLFLSASELNTRDAHAISLGIKSALIRHDNTRRPVGLIITIARSERISTLATIIVAGLVSDVSLCDNIDLTFRLLS